MRLTWAGSAVSSGMTRWNEPVPSPSGVLPARAPRLRVAQKPLRREDDERLAPDALHLAAQHVEELRRGRQIADLNVALGGAPQTALDARAPVPRPLAL